MKKLLLLIACAMMSASAMAQLQLTAEGFVSSENPEQKYVVLEFTDMPQSKLYSKALVYLNSLYVSPKEVLSLVENESISINGVGRNAIYRQKNMDNTTPTFDVNYTISVMFKDNKIRIDMPVINRMYISGYIAKEFYLVGSNFLGAKDGVFGPKGKILSEKTKISLEEYFNAYISQLKEAITRTDSDW